MRLEHLRPSFSSLKSIKVRYPSETLTLREGDLFIAGEEYRVKSEREFSIAET